MHTRTSLTILSAVMSVAVWGCGSESEDGATGGSGGSAGSAAGSAGAAGAAGAAGEAGAAGSSTSCLDSVAWYSANSTGSATDPGKKQPNAFGLYDMLGNAIEWVQDCYHENYTGAPTDGSAWEDASCEYRVIRGGCYGSTARGVRVSMRDGAKTSFYGACAPGIRCVRTSGEVPSTALIELDLIRKAQALAA